MTTATLTPETKETKPAKVYDLVEKLPIIRCYYQGSSHKHPVQRTMAVIHEDENVITGYEFRCGREVRTVAEARNCIRSYRKDRIAKYGDYIRLRASSQTLMKDPEETTLTRESILTFLRLGA